MTIKEIRLGSTSKLIEELYLSKEQSKKNLIAYELTCRMYIPFKGIEFDELLKKNGYEEIKRPKVLTYNNK